MPGFFIRPEAMWTPERPSSSTSSSFRRQAPGQAYDSLPPEPVKRDVRCGPPLADIADAEFVVDPQRSPS